MFDIFNMLKKDENTAAPKQVTRETIIGDILDMDQTTAPYFMEKMCIRDRSSRGWKGTLQALPQAAQTASNI